MPLARNGADTLTQSAEALQEDLAALYALHERDAAASPELTALLTTAEELQHASDALDAALLAGAQADLAALAAEFTSGDADATP